MVELQDFGTTVCSYTLCRLLVFSKLGGMRNNQVDAYGYGHYAGPNGAPVRYGPMTPGLMLDPAVMAYQSRSQKDLLDYCNNAPIPPHQQRQHRDYATTMEMRRMGNPAGARPQAQTPDVWSTSGCSQCPVHGTYDQGTYSTGRRRQLNHIYDMPMEMENDHEESGCCQGVGFAPRMPQGVPQWPTLGRVGNVTAGGPRNAPGGGNAGMLIGSDGNNMQQPMSPFYNELEPFANIGSGTGVLNSENQSQQAVMGGAAGGRTADPPPIPLTKL